MSIREPPNGTSTQVTHARSCVDQADCMALYDVWAPKYNQDLAPSQDNYVAPLLIAQAVLNAGSTYKHGLILDAGCGTGLVGQALAKGGASTIDGLDLSDAMLEVAEQTGVYRSLMSADLTKEIQKADETYDIITCCGTFTQGHVGPKPALREFLRITKKNGLIFATVLEETWQSGGFEEELAELAGGNMVKVVDMKLDDYVVARGDKAIFLTLQKTGSL